MAKSFWFCEAKLRERRIAMQRLGLRTYGGRAMDINCPLQNCTAQSSGQRYSGETKAGASKARNLGHCKAMLSPRLRSHAQHPDGATAGQKKKQAPIRGYCLRRPKTFLGKVSGLPNLFMFWFFIAFLGVLISALKGAIYLCLNI